MKTLLQLPVSAYASLQDGKITLESEFGGDLHFNAAGDPRNDDFNRGNHSRPFSLRLTGENGEDINVPVTPSQLESLQEQIETVLEQVNSD